MSKFFQLFLLGKNLEKAASSVVVVVVRFVSSGERKIRDALGDYCEKKNLVCFRSIEKIGGRQSLSLSLPNGMPYGPYVRVFPREHSPPGHHYNTGAIESSQVSGDCSVTVQLWSNSDRFALSLQL